MDFSKMHNPFDFANPVNDPKLFAGRKSELEDIEYYLNHAKTAPRAINLALIGDRASGKTSLLNMIEGGARQRVFLPVRIDLDESDVETQLVF
jgi:AAA+ ATPase superfamily predicted ATPase